MTMDMLQPDADGLLAVYGTSRLYDDGLDAAGNRIGHIVDEDGVAYPPKQIIQILAHGRWQRP